MTEQLKEINSLEWVKKNGLSSSAYRKTVLRELIYSQNDSITHIIKFQNMQIRILNFEALFVLKIRISECKLYN